MGATLPFKVLLPEFSSEFLRNAGCDAAVHGRDGARFWGATVMWDFYD
jgi:hypothetical protein